MKKTIAQLVPHGSRVLDLGCGNGALLAYLQQHKACTGYGVELDDSNVHACVQRGVNVLQLNLDLGLSVFADQSFDVVLQIDTLQHLKNAETMLQETLRVGKTGVIAFPNFAHWFNRWSVMHGRMPVTPQLPYEWYDTPNIRVGTFADTVIPPDSLEPNGAATIGSGSTPHFPQAPGAENQVKGIGPP